MTINTINKALIGALLVLATPVMGQVANPDDVKISASAMKRQISGMTVRSYSDDNGQAIEFYAKNGDVYLWLGGGAKLLIGKWKTCTKKGQMVGNVANSVKDVTVSAICRTLPKPGGGTQNFDTPWVSFGPSIQETAKGDLFKLAELRESPYPMGTRKTDFAYLQKQIAKGK